MASKVVLFFALIAIVIAILLSRDEFKEYRNLLATMVPFLTASNLQKMRMFTKEELSKNTGKDGTPVHLAILGEVFDVSAGHKHYGEGGGYHFFSGIDGTRAFVSGDFTETGLIESTKSLSHQDVLGIEEWITFYKKQYKHIGRLIGMYYNEEGQATEAMADFDQRLVLARENKLSEQDDKNRYPPCNFEYRQGQGRRTWCSNLSGGVQREWAGVPRQYFQPGKADPRCACVKNIGPPSGSIGETTHNNRGDLDNPLMKLYEDCDPNSFECRFKD